MSEKKAIRDHRVVRAWVHSLLAQAIKASDLKIEDSLASDDTIRKFVDYVDKARPVILIQSHFPYAELIVAELLEEYGPFDKAHHERALLSGDNAHNNSNIAADTPLVISFHEPPLPTVSAEIIHSIETTDNPVLIGCPHKQDVPLRFLRMVDLDLSLSAGDGSAFQQAFAELFEATVPNDKNDGDGHWHHFVLPTDLQHPLRMGYAPQQACEFIQQRVEGRLNRVASDKGLTLDDLHGLGPARDIARDLIHDIHLAIQGVIDWKEVDRGMLMVGPPGTGKTALARAIARECGVKFVAASAAKWQATDNLGSHLAEIDKTFAEATRHQPAVLFIDELDSIGNRDALDGNAQTYTTSVVNALLEKLDGFASREQLVVIGATNKVELIDPALKRAGRLDQVAHIPYPNITALEKIYRYYLKPYIERDQVGKDIHYKELGGISFGLTGADVELFVRGAARRARKRRDKIRQADLAAEIMRKPRGEDGGKRLSREMINQLAVHEAGHAVMQLLGPKKGTDIGYISIAPRSDGQIGYRAGIQTDSLSMNRADGLYQLQVLLAGRAAEEVCFGVEGVSDLAANYGNQSDLAQATRMAQYMTGLSGLGQNQSLLWWKGLPDQLLTEKKSLISEQLDASYADAVHLISDQRELLESIKNILLEKQEATGEMLRGLL